MKSADKGYGDCRNFPALLCLHSMNPKSVATSRKAFPPGFAARKSPSQKEKPWQALGTIVLGEALVGLGHSQEGIHPPAGSGSLLGYEAKPHLHSSKFRSLRTAGPI